MRALVACSICALFAGCATQLTSYPPTPNQRVQYDQGVGAVTWETQDAVLTMYPTFRYRSPGDIPTFTLVQNKTDHNIDFVPDSIHAWLDNGPCHVYTLEERVSEIRSARPRKQIALAIAGGLAAAGAGYAAAHQTTTVNSYGFVGNRSFFPAPPSVRTIRWPGSLPVWSSARRPVWASTRSPGPPATRNRPRRRSSSTPRFGRAARSWARSCSGQPPFSRVR